MPLARTTLAVALLAGTGCSGSIGDVPSGSGMTCDAVGPAPLRRLTHREYARTVSDLLGYTGNVAATFPSDASATGYSNQASALGVTSALVDEYMRAAEVIAASAVQDLSALLPCDPAQTGEDACARELIDTFGRRAYRRPLAAEQHDRLFALFAETRDAWGFAKGIEVVVRMALQSPHFLYRVEFGGDGPAVPLDGWEMATRLSYFLWGSMPDEALFSAAEQGALDTPEGIAAQAERMLQDPRARAAAGEFHEQWLRLGALTLAAKDPAVYPEFDDAFKAAALEESRRFLEHVVFDGAGDFDSILLADYSFVNAELAALYGVTSAGDFERTAVPGAQRAGVLTHASFLAVTSKPNQTSPVVRGKMIRELFLCEVLPEPPPGVDTTPPAIDPNATTRERFEQHSVDPTCASCHELMDPIGFGFEHYDAIGRWRDAEGGLAVDASGFIVGPDVAFDGAVELAHLLASEPRVHTCFVRNWFTWAHGRAPTAADSCSLQTLEDAFAASGRDITSLVVALTQTDAFRFRPAGEE